MVTDWTSGDLPKRRRFQVRISPHRRRSVWRVRDWRIRTKLAAILVVPSVAFLVLAGLQTGALFGEASALDQFARQVAVGREISGVLGAVQRERDRTAGELAGLATEPPGAAQQQDPADGPRSQPRPRTTSGQVRAALAPLYSEVDAAVARLRTAARPLAGADASWRISYARADDALARLDEVREAVPFGVLNANTVLGSYARAIDALLTLLAEPSPGIEQPELTDAVLRYVQLARVQDLSSQIRAQLYAAARAGRYGPDDLVRLADLRAQQLAAVGEFRITATRTQVLRYQEAAAQPGFTAATRLEETTIAGTGRDPEVLDPGRWWTAGGQRLDLLRDVQASVLADAIRQADSASTGQLRRTLLVAGVVLAVLLLAVLTSVVVGRSLARSLHDLRRQAIQVAQVELPEALDRLSRADHGRPQVEISPPVVRSMDEIGEVAESFVAVHRSAVHLAVEQAQLRRNVNAMFVNLARRSQVLVERQLELLDDLEREESDPDQLDNLFKLDHLAARMRRNDDSLLVLAGTESTRRWSQPVALPAVMLAAVAEVEQYQRIRHRVDDQVYVVGYAVADLVHLLAELLENASSFSPPDTVVKIGGRLDGAGAAIIEITDDGLGMSATALAEANAVLATPPLADVAASQRMGLFVVSHLAARQGIEVRLRAVERGVVASVRLPASVLSEPPSGEIVVRPARRLIEGLAGEDRPVSAVPATVLVDPDATAEVPVPHVAGSLPGPGVPDPRRSGADGPPAWPPWAGAVTAGTPGGATIPAGDRGTGPGDAGTGPGGGRPLDAKPAGGGWFSRSAASGSATNGSPLVGAASGAARDASGPVAGPATGAAPEPRINDRGLPVRVPMAHLPDGTEAARRVPPEPDPAAVGGMLSRLYGGIRRAEEEETMAIDMAAVRGTGEGRDNT